MSSAINTILAPVDLSSCSRAALEFACELATRFGAKLEVLFVRSPEGAGGSEALPPDALAAARAELHRFVEGVPQTKALAPNERVESGDARERIVAIADAGKFDAIVIGTHGRTGRPRSLAGSVAETVVRTASCPVVSVRERR